MTARKRAAVKVPAYKDRELRNRPGEKWADIPGLDGYFVVSNFGRIKRNVRELVNVKGFTRRLPEKIILPKVAKAYNKHVKDLVYQLHAHLAIDGKRYESIPISVSV